MERKRRKLRSYTLEFRREAVALVKGTDKPVEHIAADLGIPKGTLRQWQRADEQESSGSGSPSKAKVAAESPEAELRRLREALRVAEMERDILKKAVAFFAKENR